MVAGGGFEATTSGPADEICQQKTTARLSGLVDFEN